MSAQILLDALRSFAGDGTKPVATVTPRDIAALVERIDAGDRARAELEKLGARA